MAILLKLADRADRIKSFHVMALMDQAAQLEAQGRDIIHLEVGEPDFPTPENVVAAGVKAMQAGQTRYTGALGLPALRQAVADFYLSHLGVAVDPGRILITPGASGAIGLVTGLLFNPGDGVLLTDPGYPCNDSFLHLIGAIPQRIAVGADTQFQLTEALVRQHWQHNSRAVWLASPSNPTGTLIAMDELQKIKRFLDQTQSALVMDEIYHCLSYEQQPETVLSLPDEHDSVFVINSFSKYFNMTGWRLGWLVAPESHVPALERMAQNFYLAASTVAQHAALEAFSKTSIALYEERRAILGRRRDFLLTALSGLGVRVPVAPQGAFYIYCDISDLNMDGFEFCQNLLTSAGVAVTPGIDFGEHQANHFIRIAYTADENRLAQAVDRIAQFIKQHQ